MNKQNYETEERWAFIEKCSEEVKEWTDWKKAEVYPNKYKEEKIPIKRGCQNERCFCTGKCEEII